MEIINIYELSRLLKDGERDFGKYGMVDVKYKNDLALFNYAAPCQFKRPPEWNYFERISRGLIMNVDTGEVVARPFDKFWNYGEIDVESGAKIVEVTEKMDGSLGILYWHDGLPCIATRGSFESDQALWATEFFRNNRISLSGPGADFTLLFEIIYPENRIVVDYKGWSGLVLIGVRSRFTGTEVSLDTLKTSLMINTAEGKWLRFPEFYSFDELSSVLEARERLSGNEEGFVVRFDNGQRVKIKGDEYLQLHKFVSNFSFKNVAIAIRDGKFDDLRAVCPAMYQEQLECWEVGINEIIRGTSDDLWMSYEDVCLQLTHLEPGTTEYKKAFALIVQKDYKDIAPFLYAKRDGKITNEMLFNKVFDL